MLIEIYTSAQMLLRNQFINRIHTSSEYHKATTYDAKYTRVNSYILSIRRINEINKQTRLFISHTDDLFVLCPLAGWARIRYTSYI